MNIDVFFILVVVFCAAVVAGMWCAMWDCSSFEINLYLGTITAFFVITLMILATMYHFLPPLLVEKLK